MFADEVDESGFSLVFDVVRRFAQPLGIDLPKWEGRIIETKKIERGLDFLRLANALSALYPKGSEEKRLLDAMRLAVPR